MIEKPRECDCCGHQSVNLNRCYPSGGQEQWWCKFCTHFLSPGTEMTQNLARMGHILLEAIRTNVTKED